MTVEPILFTTNPALLAATCDGRRSPEERPAAVVVDWERRGKEWRQRDASPRLGTDTQINADTPDDLARVRRAIDVPVICRLNPPGPGIEAEADLAIRLGADEVLVPMVRRPEEIENVLRVVGGRAGVGLMVETADAVAASARFARLPLRRVYVGLIDLALDRGSPSIFSALVDGTVERVRHAFAAPFGFGGLTLPGHGAPVPTQLLLGEMSRLGCDFSFLRRSFIADVAGGDAGAGIAAVRRAAADAARRPPAVVARERQQLVDVVTRIEGRTA